MTGTLPKHYRMAKEDSNYERESVTSAQCKYTSRKIVFIIELTEATVGWKFPRILYQRLYIAQTRSSSMLIATALSI